MKPVLVYSTGHIKFGVRVDGEGVRKGEIGVIFTPNPFPNFFTISYPLVQISFLGGGVVCQFSLMPKAIERK